jgi:hypothetical protein
LRPQTNDVAPRVGDDAVRIWLYAGKPEYPALLIVVCSGQFTFGQTVAIVTM